MAKKNDAAPPPEPTFRNRIIEYGVKAADQFLANPKNARLHPQFQRDVMNAALNEVGFVAPVVESKSGVLLDGHERVWQALQNGNAKIPFVVVDVDEAEEDYVLATFDPITALATYDAQALDTLLSGVQSERPAIQQLLAGLAEKNNLIFGEEFFDAAALPDAIEAGVQKVTYLIYVSLETLEDFQRALLLLSGGDRTRTPKEGEKFAQIDGATLLAFWEAKLAQEIDDGT